MFLTLTELKDAYPEDWQKALDQVFEKEEFSFCQHETDVFTLGWPVHGPDDCVITETFIYHCKDCGASGLYAEPPFENPDFSHDGDCPYLEKLEHILKENHG